MVIGTLKNTGLLLQLTTFIMHWEPLTKWYLSNLLTIAMVSISVQVSLRLMKPIIGLDRQDQPAGLVSQPKGLKGQWVY